MCCALLRCLDPAPTSRKSRVSRMSFPVTARVYTSKLALISVLVLGLATSPALARPIGDLVPPSKTTSVEVSAGDTLEGLLRGLGFEGQLLVEIILGLSAEFDPSHLQPGQKIEVVWADRKGGQPEQISLALGDTIIELDTTGIYRARVETVPEPDLEWSEHAASTVIDGTLIAALESAGAPGGLGLDIAAALGGLVDFRRDLKGGEAIEVLYREAMLPEGEPSGRTELRYARLKLDGRLFEIAHAGEDGPGMKVFEDGEPIRMNVSPVDGARISSHFGRRKHPIRGVMRMHSGVDFAAPNGTPVHASAPGKITFVGTRRGYGKVIEIEHGSDMTTRYAHLSAVEKGLKSGQSVEAGRQIGKVGATGLATGPHLHYEVRFNGDPVDPLSDERVAALLAADLEDPSETLLDSLRETLARALEQAVEVESASAG